MENLGTKTKNLGTKAEHQTNVEDEPIAKTKKPITTKKINIDIKDHVKIMEENLPLV